MKTLTHSVFVQLLVEEINKYFTSPSTRWTKDTPHWYAYTESVLVSVCYCAVERWSVGHT